VHFLGISTLIHEVVRADVIAAIDIERCSGVKGRQCTNFLILAKDGIEELEKCAGLQVGGCIIRVRGDADDGVGCGSC
jgi:hypothetical protein